MASGSAVGAQRVRDLFPNGPAHGRRPAGHSKGGLSRSVGVLRRPGNVGYHGSVATGDQFDFSAVAYQYVEVLFDRCEGAGAFWCELQDRARGPIREVNRTACKSGLLPLLRSPHPYRGALALPGRGTFRAQSTRNPIAAGSWPLGRSFFCRFCLCPRLGLPALRVGSGCSVSCVDAPHVIRHLFLFCAC